MLTTFVKGELPSQITPYFYSLFTKYSSFLNEPKKPHQKILIFDEIMSIWKSHFLVVSKNDCL